MRLDSPDVLHAVRLFVTFFLTAGLGAHAFCRFRSLSEEGSPKLWAYFLYSMAFALSTTLNFISLVVTLATRDYGGMRGVHLGPFTVILVITYAAFAITARPFRRA